MSLDLSTRRHVRYARGYLGLDLLREADAELDAVPPAAQSLPEVLSVRVDLDMAAKRWDRVVEFGRRLAEAHPETEHAWIGWAYALRELNRIEEARSVLLEAEAHHGRTSAVLHYNLACYDALLGALKSARARFAKACRMETHFEDEGRRDPDLRALWASGSDPE
jgi:tetratricopeptide (TPR) repeat protein